jgi:tRNA threonylcarbamoyladenosine biosynthesis protein TsaB
MINTNYILSIETSGHICGVSISNSDGFLSFKNVNEKNTHDRILAEMTRQILSEAGIRLSNISAIALSGGPGSFTGLRIGCAFAKGICFDNNIKLIHVDTMSALAYSYLSVNNDINYQKIRVAINSHKNLFYIKDFSRDFDSLSEIRNININELEPEFDEQSIIIGPGAIQISEYLTDKFDKLNQSIIHELDLNVEAIDKLARKLFVENKFVDVGSYTPNYYQEFVPKFNQELR